VTPHRYWRVYITAATGTPHLDTSEIEFRASVGGADQCVGGTAIYSNQTGGFEAAKAFDDTTSTTWYINQGTFALPQWIGYDFGAGNAKDVVEFALTCWQPGESPKDFQLQYSDDGSTWTTKYTRANESWSAVGQVKAFSSSNVVTATVTTSQGQSSSASAAATSVGDVVATTRQGQTASAAASTGVSASVATSQGQHGAASASVSSATSASTSQAQGSSAQASAVTPWVLLDRVFQEDDDYTYTQSVMPARDVADGTQILVGVYNRMWYTPQSVTDTAGNTYQLITSVADVAGHGASVSWYAALNVPAATANVITVEFGVTLGPRYQVVYYVQSPSLAQIDASATKINTAESYTIATPAIATSGAGFMAMAATTDWGDYISSISPAFTVTQAEGGYGCDGYRINNAVLASTPVSYTGDGYGRRVMGVASLTDQTGLAGRTRQAQESSAAASVGAGSAITSAQGQHAAATAGARLVANAATAQGQSSSAQANVFQPGQTATSQGQTSTAEAGVSAAASAASSQAQQAAVAAEVSLDASATSAQAQSAIGQLGLSLDASAGTASAQRTSAAIASAYVAEVMTLQGQQVTAVAGVDSPTVVATGQGQGAAAECAVSIEASAFTGHRQRVRAQARAEAVNTVESGQAQVTGGVLGLSSDAPASTMQGQTSALQAGVAADSQIQLGQVQHIGDGNLLVVGVDVAVQTAQDRQSARGVLEHYVPKPGSLTLGAKRLHPVLAGTTELHTALDAPTRVRAVLSGRADLRPD
jgi:hypothetical protein